jgi:sulfur-carrier protein adenylyltransferase/sulfurtransferase
MYRFSKQIRLPNFGVAEQEKLNQASVLVIGAGGLGCPALAYLAAAGIGTLGIADNDHIEASNLNRQILYGEPDIGQNKAMVAARKLRKQYNDIEVIAIPEYLDNTNIIPHLALYDLVIDGSDNFATRYMLNDACCLLGKPWIMGAVYAHEGQVAVWNTHESPVHYRDLHPQPPAGMSIPDCNETGVLGVMPGIIGTMQAAEAIKLLAGLGSSLAGKVYYHSLMEPGGYVVAVSKNPETAAHMPENLDAFTRWNYTAQCAGIACTTWSEAFLYLAEKPQTTVFTDVREESELEHYRMPGALHLPLSEHPANLDRLASFQTIFTFCRSGARSIRSAALIKARFPEKDVYCIEGGIKQAVSLSETDAHGV